MYKIILISTIFFSFSKVYAQYDSLESGMNIPEGEYFVVLHQEDTNRDELHVRKELNAEYFEETTSERRSTAMILKSPFIESVRIRNPKHPHIWKKSKDNRPYFAEPIQYNKEPANESETAFNSNEYIPTISWLQNGDLLAIWHSKKKENTVFSSRLRQQKSKWDPPTEFFLVPDHIITSSTIFCDSRGTIYNMNGVKSTEDGSNLTMVLHTSQDNGISWSKPQLVTPEQKMKLNEITGMYTTQEGWLIQTCNVEPEPTFGTAIYVSTDQGKSWFNPAENELIPEFKKGNTGNLIAGRDARVVQLKNGHLMALGGNINIPDENGVPRMPLSISTDMGLTWNYQPSEFPPVGQGQRLAFIRLNEGPLLLVSFTDIQEGVKEDDYKGMEFNNSDGHSFEGYGMFAALSFDEGETWPIKRLITDGKTRELNGGTWNGEFTMDAKNAEPGGYLSVTQSPNNIIHLISSNFHYQFNLKWLAH